MDSQQTEQARFNMIQQQVRPWDVLDERVLEAMQAVPREDFVPEKYQNLAFADIEVPLSHEQQMMFPRVEGRMMQSLDIKATDDVLEIGTGSGYVTACLSRLGGQVTSIELYEDLSAIASEKLLAQSITNTKMVTGDVLNDGLPGGKFDVIAVTASVPSDEYLQSWRNQLSVGGRLFAIVGTAPVMEALLVTRIDGSHFRVESIFETDLPPLVGATVKSTFHF